MELTESNRQNVLLLLVILSLICLCSSFLLFVLAVNVKATIDERISLLETYNSQTIPGLFLFVGIVNMVENGSCAFVSLRLRAVENREKMMKVLLPVLIGGILLVILEISSTIASLVHMGILDREFGEGIIKAMKEYVKGKELKREIDFVQTTYKCCGEIAYTDWFRYPWIDAGTLVTTHTKYLQNNGLYYSDDTPYSCCNRRSPRPCIHHHVHDNIRHHKYDYKTETTLHHDGCRKILSAMYSAILRDISIISLLAALLKIAIILLLRLIHTSLTMAQQIDDWEATTPAYIYFFKGDDEGNYQKVGDTSETEDEGGDDSGGGGDGDDSGDDGDETTATEDESALETTDAETDDVGDETEDEKEPDTNVNFSPPRGFVGRNSRMNPREGRSRIPLPRINSGKDSRIPIHRQTASVDKVSIPNKNITMGTNNLDDFDGNTRVRRGSLTKMNKSKIVSSATGMGESFTHSRYEKAMDPVKDNFSRLANSRIGSRNGSDLYRREYRNDYNDNKMYMEKSGRSNYFKTKSQTKKEWDFPCAEKQQGSITGVDRLTLQFVKQISNSDTHPDSDESLHDEKISKRSTVRRENNKPTKNYEDVCETFSESEDRITSVMSNTTNTHVKAVNSNSKTSSIVNSVSDFTDYTVNGSARNASELPSLRNMKTKSTDNSSDKWSSLSVVPGASADKGVVQFASHPEDKLVDISDDSNGLVSEQESITDRSGTSDSYGFEHNSTSFSLKTQDSWQRESSRRKKETKSKSARQLFNFYPEFDVESETTPSRLNPPVIWETTLHGNPNQQITRPKPIMANGQTPEIVAIDQTWSSISTPMVDASRTTRTFHQQTLSHYLEPSTTSSMSKNGISSEYDLIPTIQRRGHDSKVPDSTSGIYPEYSGDEISPEVAGINFPRSLNMDCYVDIDTPTGLHNDTASTSLLPTAHPIPIYQKIEAYSRDASVASTLVGKTTCSSSNLDTTMADSQCNVKEFFQMPSQTTDSRVSHYQQHYQHRSVPGIQCPDTNNDSFSSGSSVHERRNHVRSSHRKNIFLASPLSSNGLDISISCADSRLFPKTSTPAERNSHLCTRPDYNQRDWINFNGGDPSMPTQNSPLQTLSQQYSQNLSHSKESSVPEPNKFVDNLIDLSDSYHEGIHHGQTDHSGDRNRSLISPFY